MTEQVPATKHTPIVVEETIEVPVAENDTESITPEKKRRKRTKTPTTFFAHGMKNC
jgi:hypothetical protein